MAIVLGAALGNVIRGVPLGEDNYFFLPLWTNWRVGPEPGILDWYTVIGGVVALVALATHGALYLALKATNELEMRAVKFAKAGWVVLCIVTLVSLPATIWVRPSSLTNYSEHPLLFIVPLAVLLTLGGMRIYAQKGKTLAAFLSSCGYLIFMLVGAAAGLYPVLLPSSSDPARDITIAKALSGLHALHVGLAWWTFGMALALTYFVVTYRMFRGKVSIHEEGDYGH